MSCCSDYMNLGCVPTCGTAVLPFEAKQSGIHILLVHFSGVIFQYPFDATLGSNLEIPLSALNENACLKFQIVQPDGTYFKTESENKMYECFMLRTQIGLILPVPEICISDYVEQGYWSDNYMYCEI